jgi:hypothetical protein
MLVGGWLNMENYRKGIRLFIVLVFMLPFAFMGMIFEVISLLFYELAEICNEICKMIEKIVIEFEKGGE